MIHQQPATMKSHSPSLSEDGGEVQSAIHTCRNTDRKLMYENGRVKVTYVCASLGAVQELCLYMCVCWEDWDGRVKFRKRPRALVVNGNSHFRPRALMRSNVHTLTHSVVGLFDRCDIWCVIMCSATRILPQLRHLHFF